MASTLIATPAAEITARLDRLPMTRHMWMLVLLISLGGWFDTYAIFLTGSIAPGMFADKIFTPTTVSLFGFTGLASFIAALFTGLFIGTMFFTQAADRFGRRTVFTYSLVWYCIATLVMAFQYTPGGINLWRMIAGIGIGVELVTVDTFISELVPKRARGKTFAIQQSIGFIPVPLVALLAWLLNPTAPFGLSGWRWVVIIGSVGAIIVWFVRLKLPESPRWLAQQGRLEAADRVMSGIEAKVAAESGRPLPAPEPPVVEDPRKGKLSEIFNPTYRSRTIMLSVANFFQTIGFYGFANWVPTLLIAKGIHVSQTLEYSFIIAFAYPLFPLFSSLFADRVERKWQVCLSCIGIAAFGIAFSFQTEALPLIIIGTLQTMMNAWLSFSAHNYQSELFPTRVRATAVGFVYSWSRFSTIFTGFIIAAILQRFGVPGVFMFVASAMAVVVLSIALFGPRTNQRSLEEISRSVPQRG
ncbi:MAG: transporter, putative metabolite:H+ symporter [Acetobacteraceae bacterium]|jgi:putative MFS transporter|nr:transporter [Rhodopila sp.]MEA2732019.1 transporter, putative metabolite:H+ symporter [Acetobacteraceae bacterium]